MGPGFKLIVDDEPLARSNLDVLLRRDPDVESVQQCASGAEAVQEIRSARPNLVFLDVQMPECGGFDVLGLLKGEPQPVIVFVTAYDAYALRAFDAGALDYLLKPFDDARFQLAMLRAKQKIAQQENASPPEAQRLTLRSVGQISYVQIPDIDWVAAEDYYVRVHVGGKSHLLRWSIAGLQRELDPRSFCRIHRSTIVNLRGVRGLRIGAHGEYDVLLDSGERLRVSRRFRKELKARMLARAGA
ncbi:MAG: LytR/AlgR family response regulator transcription factor [Steroidobacteraceae bacterium]